MTVTLRHEPEPQPTGFTGVPFKPNARLFSLSSTGEGVLVLRLDRPGPSSGRLFVESILRSKIVESGETYDAKTIVKSDYALTDDAVDAGTP